MKTINQLDIINRISEIKFYSVESFMKDANLYLQALRENRLLFIVKLVNIKQTIYKIRIEELKLCGGKYILYGYGNLLTVCGFKLDKEFITITNPETDVIFDLNKSILEALIAFHIISESELNDLINETIHVIY